jgi:hypothetical protein
MRSGSERRGVEPGQRRAGRESGRSRNHQESARRCPPGENGRQKGRKAESPAPDASEPTVRVGVREWYEQNEQTSKVPAEADKRTIRVGGANRAKKAKKAK